MSKPTVAVFLPTVVQIGVPFRLELEVTTEDEAKVEFIDVRLASVQGWAVGSGKSRVTEKRTFPALEARVMGDGILAAGSSRRFSVELVLPPGSAPTHREGPAYAHTNVRVHVSLPWRIDVRHDVEMRVNVAPPASLIRLPGVAGTQGHEAGGPRIELALASVRLVAGEVLHGTVAVFHMDDREPRDIELSLVPQFNLTSSWRERVRDGAGFRTAIRLPAGSAGHAVSFAMQVPQVALPSFRALTQTVTWRLDARTGSFFGAKATTAIALEILDPVSARDIPPAPPPPRIADAASSEQFREAAAQRPGALLADEDRALTTEVDDVHVTIAYAYRQDGDAYVATLAYPALGLDLRVAPSSVLRHVFITDLEVEVAAWDRSHYADARFAEQAAPFMKAVIPAWPTWPQTTTDDRKSALVRWNDTELVFELPIARVVAGEIVAAFDRFVRLAKQLAQARAQLTPPPGLVVAADAWTALARELDGHFSIGDLAVAGSIGGLPCEVVWSRQDDGTDVFTAAVGQSELAAPEVAAIEFEVAVPARFSSAPKVPDAVAAQLTQWPLDVQKLQVAGGIARARLVVRRERSPVTVDARRIRELLEGLRAVMATLSQTMGPYR